MAPDEAFLEAILANLEDDTPRLVYADWLTDRDDPRGEFIHVQCLLARMTEDDPRRTALEDRESELLNRHQDDWLGTLRPLLSGWTFRRGFLDEVAVPPRALAESGRFIRPATVRRVEVDLVGAEVPLETVEFMPESVARENLVFPLAHRPDFLLLAMAREDDRDTLQKLQFILNRDIEAYPAPADQIRDAIERHYGRVPRDEAPRYLEEFVDAALDWPGTANEPPVVRLVNLILLEAVTLRASEVRIEPQPDHVLVVYRIGNNLTERDRLPSRLLGLITNRLCMMASLAPATDAAAVGRIRLSVAGQIHEVELAVTPTDVGPRLVLTPGGRMV
jgi:uncharacterized protein (TIGR02996 family)